MSGPDRNDKHSERRVVPYPTSEERKEQNIRNQELECARREQVLRERQAEIAACHVGVIFQCSIQYWWDKDNENDRWLLYHCRCMTWTPFQWLAMCQSVWTNDPVFPITYQLSLPWLAAGWYARDGTSRFPNRPRAVRFRIVPVSEIQGFLHSAEQQVCEATCVPAPLARIVMGYLPECLPDRHIIGTST